jgi:hypothetical protein
VFIRDGLLLAVSDGQISGAETAWLQSVAEKNGLAGAWAAELAEKSRRERKTFRLTPGVEKVCLGIDRNFPNERRR